MTSSYLRLEHGVEIIYPAAGPRESTPFKALHVALEVLSGFPFMDDTVIRRGLSELLRIVRKLQDKERIADLITDGEELEQSRFATLL